MKYNKKIAAHIDHTVLKTGTTKADINRLCEEAVLYGFAAVCVPPVYVKNVKGQLNKTDIKIATVAGFPLGYSETMTKVSEALMAILNGADEIDMVVNIALIKNKEWKKVEQEYCYRFKIFVEKRKQY